MNNKDLIIDDIISQALDDEIDRLHTLIKDIENKYNVDIWINYTWDYKNK